MTDKHRKCEKFTVRLSFHFYHVAMSRGFFFVLFFFRLRLDIALLLPRWSRTVKPQGDARENKHFFYLSTAECLEKYLKLILNVV